MTSFWDYGKSFAKRCPGVFLRRWHGASSHMTGPYVRRLACPQASDRDNIYLSDDHLLKPDKPPKLGRGKGTQDYA